MSRMHKDQQQVKSMIVAEQQTPTLPTEMLAPIYDRSSLRTHELVGKMNNGVNSTSNPAWADNRFQALTTVNHMKGKAMANRVRATVNRLFVHRAGTNVRLDIPENQAPLDGYFKLEATHPNYYSLYSLALTAAINRHPLLVRVVGEIVPGKPVTVNYMMVDW